MAELDPAEQPAQATVKPGPGAGAAQPPAQRGTRGLIAIAILALVAFAPLMFFFGPFGFQSSEVFQLAMEAARDDPQVVAALGEPIEAGWLITGEISENGLLGEASLAIPIHGPKGRGTLYVQARRENGEWQFYTLAVRVHGRDDPIVLR